MSYKANYYTAIVAVEIFAGQFEFKKYRDIPIVKTGAFESFVKGKFSAARHINYYRSDTKEFVKQVYLRPALKG
jgi:hypothetical protein